MSFSYYEIAGVQPLVIPGGIASSIYFSTTTASQVTLIPGIYSISTSLLRTGKVGGLLQIWNTDENNQTALYGALGFVPFDDKRVANDNSMSLLGEESQFIHTNNQQYHGVNNIMITTFIQGDNPGAFTDGGNNRCMVVDQSQSQASNLFFLTITNSNSDSRNSTDQISMFFTRFNPTPSSSTAPPISVFLALFCPLLVVILLVTLCGIRHRCPGLLVCFNSRR